MRRSPFLSTGMPRRNETTNFMFPVLFNVKLMGDAFVLLNDVKEIS